MPKIIKKLLVFTVFLAGGARESPEVGSRRQKRGNDHKTAEFPILAQKMPPSATGPQRNSNGAGKTMVCEAAKMLFSGDPLIGKQKKSFRVAETKKKRLERSCREVKYSPDRHCAQNLINLMKKHALLVPDHVKFWNFQENHNRLDGICAKSFPPRNSEFPEFCKIHEKRPSGDAPDPLFSLSKSPLDPKRCKLSYFY